MNIEQFKNFKELRLTKNNKNNTNIPANHPPMNFLIGENTFLHCSQKRYICMAYVSVYISNNPFLPFYGP